MKVQAQPTPRELLNNVQSIYNDLKTLMWRYFGDEEQDWYTDLLDARMSLRRLLDRGRDER